MNAMSRRYILVSTAIFSLVAFVPPVVLAQEEQTVAGTDPTAQTSHPAQSTVAQAGDPTAPIYQIQFTDFYMPSMHNADGNANLFEFQPVIPLAKSKRIPVPQILRLTVPVITTPRPNRTTGLGDITVDDLFIAPARSWGIWGAGVVLTVPSATDDERGAGKWQLGPTATMVYYGVRNWQIGALFQNPISFAGDDNRDSVNQLTVQPIINYLYKDWYFGAGDFNIVFDWEEGGDLTLPLAFQAGRIVTIGRDNFNISAELEWSAIYPDNAVVPRWGIKLGFVWLLGKS